MVNDAVTIGDEVRLALSYAAGPVQPALDLLLTLDATLGGILRTTREPLVGQMRLTWWREALQALDAVSPPGEPILTGLAQLLLPRGVTGARLAGVVDGWEALLAPHVDDAAMTEHGRARGGTLFAAAAHLLGGEPSDHAVLAAGEGWALVDLARNLSDRRLAGVARQMAAERLDAALAEHWPRRLRALGALAWLARMDLAVDVRPAGHPARVGRLLRFRLTGR